MSTLCLLDDYLHIHMYICICVYICTRKTSRGFFKNYNYEMIEKIMEIFPRFIYIFITFNLAP